MFSAKDMLPSLAINPEAGAVERAIAVVKKRPVEDASKSAVEDGSGKPPPHYCVKIYMVGFRFRGDGDLPAVTNADLTSTILT